MKNRLVKIIVPMCALVMLTSTPVYTVEATTKHITQEPEITIEYNQPINEDFDILVPCGYSQEELNKALENECFSEMRPHITALLMAEELYGVNAFYLMCKLGYESGWGKYMSAENNIGGWKNPDCVGFRNFESVDECIFHIAMRLSSTYKDDVGSKIKDVSRKYCPDDGYLEMLLTIMKERENAILRI